MSGLIGASPGDVRSQRPRSALWGNRLVGAMNQKLQMTIAYEEPDEKGWIVARVVEVPGAMSQGRTREEARENVVDALAVMLAPDDDDASVAAGRSEQLDLPLSLSVKLRDLERHLTGHGAPKSRARARDLQAARHPDAVRTSGPF